MGITSVKTFVAFAALTATVFSAQITNDTNKQKFEEFRQKYNKTYTNSSRVTQAQNNFAKNVKNIQEHNARTNETYKRDVSYHSDMSYNEKVETRMGAKRATKEPDPKMQPKHVIKNITAPPEVNYTRFFPPIKNQKTCGACWAFAANAILEYWEIRAGNKLDLSEQNLVDCVEDCSGCHGGWPTTAFDYVKTQGVSDGKKYIYGSKSQTCQRKLSTPKYPAILKIPNACELSLNGDEDKLKKLIAQYGPVAGTLYATDGFTSYKSGVFYDKTCPNKSINHAVAIVGYGTDKQHGNYWIVRNSWGKSWGMQGYGLIARNKKNHCGIALYAMFPC